MRLLIWTKYGSRSASTRHRFELYVPGLVRRGISVEVRALFDDAYLRSRFRHRGWAAVHALRGFGTRLLDLIRRVPGDLHWIHSELLPYFPLDAHRLGAWLAAPFVVDLDDAIFHRYDMSSSVWVRGVLGRKFPSLVRGAAAVTAGSPYLVRWAESHGARVTHVPTVVDPQRVPFTPRSIYGRPPVVGWIGSPSTTPYLDSIREPLRAAASRVRFRVLAVGASRLRWSGLDLEQREWSLARENSDLAEMDVGIMPMPDVPWTRGKCGFKLIQYMASGAAALASPVGANLDIVDGSCGRFAASPEEWETRLVELVTEPEQMRRMGENGRRRVEARYSLQSQEERVYRTLVEAASMSSA